MTSEWAADGKPGSRVPHSSYRAPGPLLRHRPSFRVILVSLCEATSPQVPEMKRGCLPAVSPVPAAGTLHSLCAAARGFCEGSAGVWPGRERGRCPCPRGSWGHTGMKRACSLGEGRSSRRRERTLLSLGPKVHKRFAKEGAVFVAGGRR